MFRYRVRDFLLVGALVALPPLLLGLAPALQDLFRRIDQLETESDLEALVVDSNGSVLGPVAQVEFFPNLENVSNTIPRVIVTYDSSTFWVDVTKGSIEGSVTTVLFESEDCSGAGYISGWQLNPATMFPPVVVTAEPDSTIWVAKNPETITSIYQQSFLRAEKPGCVTSSNEQPVVTLATPVLKWRESFAPPFRVATRGELLAN